MCAASDPDLRRANAIDTDDTSSLIIELASGLRLAAALSVTAPRRHEPYVLLRGRRGHALYFYTLDLLQVHRPGATLPRTYQFARTGLLADLVSHVRGGTALAVPLAATGAFTRVLEAGGGLAAAAHGGLRSHHRRAARRRAVPGCARNRGMVGARRVGGADVQRARCAVVTPARGFGRGSGIR